MFLCENAFDYRVPPPGVRIDQKFLVEHPNMQIFCEAYIDSLYKVNIIHLVDILVIFPDEIIES